LDNFLYVLYLYLLIISLVRALPYPSRTVRVSRPRPSHTACLDRRLRRPPHPPPGSRFSSSFMISYLDRLLYLSCR
jgi:hypothetical protein